MSNVKISFLLDTNILIQMEELDQSGILKEPFAEFSKLIHKFGLATRLHPILIEEIKKDKDKKRREATLIKARKYPLIENPPMGELSELKERFGGINNENDLIDCQLLYSLQSNCVNYLVTEDNVIHKRAKQSYLSDRVLSISEAKNLIFYFFEPELVILPHVAEEFIYNINKEDAIFDSLRKDYDSFDNWLDKCSREQRKAWVIYKDSEITGICIYKHDERGEHEFINYPSLKICTYKVSENYRGEKIGELLIKKAFLYSVKNGLSSCWMTVYGKHGYLIEFIKSFGFFPVGFNTRTELIFKKQFFVEPGAPDLEPLDFHIRYFPHYMRNETIGKYLIPIKKKYHHILFPEKQTQSNLTMMEFEESIPGNTIRKVYLCHSSTKKLKKGDLLFFYVSSPIQAVMTLGIIESTYRSSNLNEIMSIIGKRSVYKFNEVKKMSKKETLILNFRFINHFEPELSLEKLKRKGITSRAPQSISELKHEKYLKLKKIIDAG